VGNTAFYINFEMLLSYVRTCMYMYISITWYCHLHFASQLFYILCMSAC